MLLSVMQYFTNRWLRDMQQFGCIGDGACRVYGMENFNVA
ncbi:hypothetical protein GAGA_1813 [Paraglaciecola agarilytica NO2]|uniref:Uncharacterized protein n=1 Tax=Paraglaciecola agarilytica NO2 TaxID=1125747 RepID=A0ABQ0I5Q4_9ALTE|nr:hypothetical protein GAGA_1813 [Paraglaciecola agarilytica NO2]